MSTRRFLMVLTTSEGSKTPQEAAQSAPEFKPRQIGKQSASVEPHQQN